MFFRVARALHPEVNSVLRALMICRTYIPQPPLSQFVDCFWFYDGYVQPHAKERLLPDGSTGLVVNLREDNVRVYDREDHNRLQKLSGSVICGPHSESFVIDTAEQASVIGVHFRPGGAYPFFNLPAGELLNMHVSLETLWGRKAGELRERLLEANGPDAKLQVLEQVLLAQAARPLQRHRAVAFALQEFHGLPGERAVAEVTSQIGLSARRFIDVFRDEVGLTPKLFCRVRRFQNVLRRVKKRQRVEWADVAVECGYFDQAHFIRDFQTFSGINPSDYLRHCTEHLNHVPLLD